jgi:hypothetical protein
MKHQFILFAISRMWPRTQNVLSLWVIVSTVQNTGVRDPAIHLPKAPCWNPMHRSLSIICLVTWNYHSGEVFYCSKLSEPVCFVLFCFASFEALCQGLSYSGSLV